MIVKNVRFSETFNYFRKITPSICNTMLPLLYYKFFPTSTKIYLKNLIKTREQTSKGIFFGKNSYQRLTLCNKLHLRSLTGSWMYLCRWLKLGINTNKNAWNSRRIFLNNRIFSAEVVLKFRSLIFKIQRCSVATYLSVTINKFFKNLFKIKKKIIIFLFYILRQMSYSCVLNCNFGEKLPQEYVLPQDSYLNPNKTGLFEGSFSWGMGGQSDPPFNISRKTYLISIWPYTIVKESI